MTQRTITRRLLAFDTGEGIRARRNLAIAYGQHVTVTADDDVETGLDTVQQIVASADDDPAVDAFLVTATAGDQAGTPPRGSVKIKTWKSTGPGNTELIPATAFGVEVNWIAFGTLT